MKRLAKKDLEAYRSKQEIETAASIAQIYLLQDDTAGDREQESLDALHREQEAEAERQRIAREKTDSGSKPERDAEPAGQVREPAPTRVAAPKPVASVSQILSRTHEGVYLESQQEVDAFLDALKRELDDAIQANKRVRLS